MFPFRTFLRAGVFARVLPAVLLGPGIAAAQAQLDRVIVTGTREPQPLSQSAADVVVIDAATIRDSAADSVEDLLRIEAGIQLARNGGPGQTSGYFVRGASTNGTVVLIDGVIVGSASLGQASFDALTLDQIDHIEVLRGPASSLYGANAVGGVIQIFTRRGDGPPRPTAHLAGGSYRSYLGSAGISGSQGGFDYAAMIGREASGGVSAVRPNDRFGNSNPDDDGYGRNFGNLKLGYTPAAGHRIGVNVVASELDARYDGADVNPPDYLPDASPDFRNHLRSTIVAIDYSGVISPVWTTTLQGAQNFDDAKGGGATLSEFKTRREQVLWQNALRWSADHQLMLAYEYLREQVSGNVFSDEPRRNNNGFVAGYAGRFGAAGLQASVRFDDNSAYGNNTTGSLGATWQATSQFKLRALAGTTFRAPTFNDLYYPGYGVSTIKPEQGRSIEAGALWQSGSANASATVYRNDVDDLIGYDPDPNGTNCPPGYFGCAGNVARARLQGATFSFGQQWGGWDVSATVDLLDATDRDTGERLPRRAAHQETLAVNYTYGAWTVGASAIGVGSRPDGGVTLGAYGILNLLAYWRFAPQWRLEARLLNALDKDVEPMRDYQGYGLQAWIGVRFDDKGF